MTCRQIDELLDTPSGVRAASVSSETARHLERCERCRRLFEFLEAKPPNGEVSPELQARIEAAIRNSMTVASPMRPPRVFALLLFAIFFFIPVAATVLGGRASTAMMSYWQLGIVSAILAGGAALLAVSMSRQMVPGSRHRVRPKVAMAAAAGAFLLGVVWLFPWRFDEGFLGSGLRCMLHGAIFAVPSGIVFLLIVRRGFIISWPLLGATTGLLAGLVGAMVLHFQCQVLEASHLAVWHVGLPLVCGLAGLILGRLAGSRGAGSSHESA